MCIRDRDNDDKLQIISDGGKNEHVVGAAVAILIGNELIRKLMLRPDNTCSNNQGEQLTIMKELEESYGCLLYTSRCV